MTPHKILETRNGAHLVESQVERGHGKLVTLYGAVNRFGRSSWFFELPAARDYFVAISA
ncbi:MAG: hypothetical protein ACK5VI_01775 [Opitutia bacterium]